MGSRASTLDMPWLDWDMCSHICYLPWFRAIILTWNFPAMVVWIGISLYGYTCIFEPDQGLVAVVIYTTWQVLLFVLSSFRCWSLYCCFYSVTSSTLWLGVVSLILKLVYEYVHLIHESIQTTKRDAALETAANTYKERLKQIQHDLHVDHQAALNAAKADHAVEMKTIQGTQEGSKKALEDKHKADLQKMQEQHRKELAEALAVHEDAMKDVGRGGGGRGGARGAVRGARRVTTGARMQSPHGNRPTEHPTHPSEYASTEDEDGAIGEDDEEVEEGGSSVGHAPRTATPPLPESRLGFGGVPRRRGDPNNPQQPI